MSSTKNGDKTAATAENSTAVAIANAKSGETVTDNGATVKAATEMTTEELLQATASGAAKTFAEIDSKEKLLAFRDAWNAGKLAGGTFKLTANIDISGEDWLPIGTWEYPFYGTIDGNGKTINGLTKTRLANEDVYSEGSSTKYNGVVFGFIAIAGGGDVEVKDLTFANVNINLSTAANVGAVIGYAPKNDDFADSKKGGTYWSKTEVEGKKVLPSNYGTDDITLTNVAVSGSVSAKSHVAGLIGKAYNTGSVELTSCVSDVVVSESDSGGLSAFVGYLYKQSSVTFTSCKSTENSKLIAAGTNVNSIGDFYGSKGYTAPAVTSCSSQTKLELPENFTTTVQSTTITMYSDCIVEGVTFTSSTSVFLIRGNMTLKNCVIQTKNFQNEGNLTIEDSIVNVGFENYGTTTIKSGTFNIPVTNWLGGTMNIEDGSFTKSDASGSVISNYGSLTITGYTTITNTKDASYNDKITNQEDTTTHTIGTLTIGNGEAITSGGPHLVSAVKK